MLVQVKIGRLDQVRLSLVRLGQVRLGQVRFGQVRFGQDRLGLVIIMQPLYEVHIIRLIDEISVQQSYKLTELSSKKGTELSSKQFRRKFSPPLDESSVSHHRRKFMIRREFCTLLIDESSVLDENSVHLQTRVLYFNYTKVQFLSLDESSSTPPSLPRQTQERRAELALKNLSDIL